MSLAARIAASMVAAPAKPRVVLVANPTKPGEKATVEDVLAAQRGDRAAMTRVMASLERMCWWFAKKYVRQLPSTLTLEDAVQECRWAAMTAIRKFDPEAGAQLHTYATIWMRAKLGRHLQIERIGAAPHVQNNGKFFSHRVVSTETPLNEDGDRTLGDTLVDSGDLEADTERQQTIERVRAAIAALGDHRLRLVLEARMAEVTLDDIGQVLGLSKERVRQLEDMAKARLARILTTNGEDHD